MNWKIEKLKTKLSKRAIMKVKVKYIWKKKEERKEKLKVYRKKFCFYLAQRSKDRPWKDDQEIDSHYQCRK